MDTKRRKKYTGPGLMANGRVIKEVDSDTDDEEGSDNDEFIIH
jgi:hypothetical protein